MFANTRPPTHQAARNLGKGLFGNRPAVGAAYLPPPTLPHGAPTEPGAYVGAYRATQPAKLRAEAGMTSAPTGQIEAGDQLEVLEASLDAEPGQVRLGSAALSLCPSAQPLYTRFLNIFGS